MARETWTFEELFGGLDPAPAFVSELERLGLLRVVARDGKGAPLYAPEAREQLDKVLALVELGYQPRDIAAIARKVGLPVPRRGLFRRRPTFIRVKELARRSGIAPELLDQWRVEGLVEPAMVSEGGEPLFPVAAVEQVRCLQDLLDFGFGDEELGLWAAAERDLDAAIEAHKARDGEPLDAEARARIDGLLARADRILATVSRRVDGLRQGLRRWDKVLGAYDKRLERLRRAHGVEAPRPRLSKRRRLRSRARGRKLDSE
jgi:DNA-binding transcriptional MerR regulator